MALLNQIRKITVEPVLFLYMLCIFMVFPLLQQLAFKKICLAKYDHEICNNLTKAQEDFVHEDTSRWILYQSVALTLPSICASLILGSWSDKVGRKVVLTLPCVGNVLLYISHILNAAFASLDVNFLLIGVCISGIFGGFATLLLAVFSYISDITDKSQRTVRVAILESMIFLGGTVGNLIGGVLLDHRGFMAAFGLCLGVMVVIILYITFLLPESYYPQGNQEGNWALVAVHNHIKACFRVLHKQRPQNQRLNISVVMFGVLSISLIIFAGYNDITPLYSIHSPRNFSPSLLGYFLAEVSFMKGVGVVLMIPFLTKILKWSDLTIAIVGVFLSIMFYIFLAFASTKLLMFIAGLTAFGSGMSPPCLRSVLSKQVESSELGTMFALVASLEVLETLLGSVIFNNIYSATVDWNPGFCYFLMPAMLVLPIALMIWLYILQRRDTPYIAMDTGDRSQSPEDSINADEAINKSSNGSQYGSQVSTA